jgi:hypothetical protein
MKIRLSRGYFGGITLLGSILLLDIAVRLYRAPAGFAGWDYFDWGLNATLVVAIWFVYRRQLNNLDKLTEQVEEKALVRLSADTFSIALFAYLFLLQTLSHLRHH